jgi:hypothetical protein
VLGINAVGTKQWVHIRGCEANAGGWTGLQLSGRE